MPLTEWAEQVAVRQRFEAQFPDLPGTLVWGLWKAALHRRSGWHPGHPLPPGGGPTLAECYAVPEADLLAQYNIGRRKVARWRAWAVTHPLRPDPDWVWEE